MKTSFAFLLLLVGKYYLLYPYGEAVGDQKNPKDDDGTSPEIHISQPYSFYGKKYNSLFVNNNGVVSFGKQVSQFTPDPFPLGDNQAFVAPYWGDVNNVLGGEIYYRETQDPDVLRRATKDVNAYYPDAPFTATWTFIATWDKVAYFGSASRKRNTFQAVLITDGSKSIIILNYANIEWTTGLASGGNARTGLGGFPAQAGFNSGDDKNYYNIPNSRTDEILHIGDTSNVEVPGRWVFEVDDVQIESCLNDKTTHFLSLQFLSACD
uniref:NIDO domain-containing protein n=1 Tax=Sphenodon punctatus TaxID=8508 RepID=A0A8D0G9T0_SPHPU